MSTITDPAAMLGPEVSSPASQPIGRGLTPADPGSSLPALVPRTSLLSANAARMRLLRLEERRGIIGFPSLAAVTQRPIPAGCCGWWGYRDVFSHQLRGSAKNPLPASS